ncbi:ABC transporter permease subunit [Halobacteriales archaeon Cl-PHB]
MSWRLVATKDVGDAIRQYHLHAAVLLFVLLFGGTAYITTEAVRYSTVDPEAVAFGLTGLGMFLVPLVAVAFAQGIVVEMRTRGDLKLLLGMPFSRRDVVLGSFAGRVVLVCAAVLAGVAVATLVALARGAPVAFDTLLAATALVCVLGVVFVALSVAISASVSTTTRSGAIAMGVFFLFAFDLWRQVPRIVLYVLNGFRFPQAVPRWVSFVVHLNPVLAFRDAMRPVLPAITGFSGDAAGTLPVYRTVPFAVLLLALWILVPLVLGVRRFQRTDL